MTSQLFEAYSDEFFSLIIGYRDTWLVELTPIISVSVVIGHIVNQLLAP